MMASRISSTAIILTLSTLLAASAALAEPPPSTATPKSDGKEQVATRNFYDVLEDVLGDFEYDLKNGQVQGLKDLSIRNIATSENIPPSFKQHLELVVTERIMKNSRTRVIQCLPCKAKRSTLTGDQMIITSPETNPVELARIAKTSMIAHFMDIAFSYQPSGMVLSMYIVEPESGSVVWSRSYNSEVSRSAAFRRGVDYTQIEEARKQNEYQPSIQHRVAAYYLFERNVSGTTGCIGLGYRMMERYDNRRKEVGFEINYIKDASSIVSSSKDNTNLWGGVNATLLFMHSWNLIGPEENFNLVRGNIFVGIGGTYASGFLGGLIRGGYEWRLAKRWAVSPTLGYRPKATKFVGASEAGAVSGLEFGFGISHLF